MVIDTSAIFAIVLDEPEAAPFLEMLMMPLKPKISAGTLMEIAAVSTRGFNGTLNARIAVTLESVDPEVMPFTATQAILGQAAYREYGLGSGHRARLNFGDCFSYALAKATGEPLLFKGDDFTHTDVLKAI